MINPSSLRPYQHRAFLSIHETFRREKKILLCMATGAGKTVIFCHILKLLLAKGKRGLMVVRGRKLVKQAADRLKRENTPFSICMAGEKDYDETKLIQVCSIDTLYSRKLVLPADLIIIDEAHLAASNAYDWLAKTHPDSWFLGVTATPYCGKSLRHIANSIINPVTMNELIAQKYLVPPRYFSISEPNLIGVKKTKGVFGEDYNGQEINKIMNQKGITTDIIDKWKKYGENRQTICFACSVEHSKSLASEFVMNGIIAQHIDASTPDYLREYYFQKFQDKQIQVITNCNILSLGVDLPICSCILMARPTDSLALYIQQCGRGTRTFPGKEDFIILDCAGNVLRHGFITTNFPVSLDGKTTNPQLKISRCPQCFFVHKGGQCPNCGYMPEKKERELKEIDCDLKEIKEDKRMMISEFNKNLIRTQQMKGYKKSWCYFKIKDKFGESVARQYYPQYYSFYNLKK